MSVETELELRNEIDFVVTAGNRKIVDQPSYDEAVRLLTEFVLPFRRRWAEYWEPLKKAAHQAHKAVLAKFAEGDDPAAKAEKSLKDAIYKWDEAQKEIERQAQLKAQQEAEEKERADRAAEAFFQEESGAPAEEVQAIVAAPSTAVAEPVGPTYIRDRAVSTRENWKCEVVDLKALCKAIGAGKVPDWYVEPNMAALNKRAQADKLTMDVPGCRARNFPIVAGRAKS